MKKDRPTAQFPKSSSVGKVGRRNFISFIKRQFYEKTLDKKRDFLEDFSITEKEEAAYVISGELQVTFRKSKR